MKLKEFEIYCYNLKTTLGFNRKGLVVKLINDLNQEGIGEIAPLPGRSIESFDDALHFTKKVRDRFLLHDFTPTFFPPSVMFGIESALFDLLHPQKNYLSCITYSNKLKLKNLNIKESVELCKNSPHPLRIDLNKGWDIKKTVQFCSYFQPSDFLYIEEPVSHFTDLEKFYDQTQFPYAVDEHLSEQPLDRILNLKGLSYLIIKPSLQGGLTRCKEIFTQAKQIKCIFSSLYETGIGLTQIAKIGATLNPNEPLGIDTHDIFLDPITEFKPKELFKNNLSIAWNQLQKI